MAGDNQSKFSREFTLKVVQGLNENEGLDFGTKALIDALVDDIISRHPDCSREEACGEMLNSAILRYADEVFGEERAIEMWAEGQAAARKKYNIYEP